jgi:hypothetical protein
MHDKPYVATRLTKVAKLFENDVEAQFNPSEEAVTMRFASNRRAKYDPTEKQETQNKGHALDKNTRLELGKARAVAVHLRSRFLAVSDVCGLKNCHVQKPKRERPLLQWS